MSSTPEFSSVFEQNKARLLGGAHRLDALYLLDGRRYGAALSAYAHAFNFYPPAALKEWHRVVYAGLALLGFTRLRTIYTQIRSAFHRAKPK